MIGKHLLGFLVAHELTDISDVGLIAVDRGEGSLTVAGPFEVGAESAAPFP